MNTHFQDLIPKDFHDNSRIWIYQSDREFSKQEAAELKIKIAEFAEAWNSHGSAVKSFGDLFLAILSF